VRIREYALSFCRLERTARHESLADPNNTWVQPASAGKAVSRDDLIRATATQGIGGNGQVGAQGIIAAVWGVPAAIIHCSIHVLLARHRAYGKQAEYSPGFAGGDDRADAFRHMFASMYLRRYCSSYGSALLMNTYEARGGPAA